MSTQRATNEALKAWMASRPEEEQQVVALKMFVSAHASQARFDVEECGSMYKYEIILYWSNADSAFVAERTSRMYGSWRHSGRRSQERHSSDGTLD